MRSEEPRWWRETERGDTVWMQRRYWGFTFENLRVWLYGSDSAQTRTTAMSIDLWAAYAPGPVSRPTSYLPGSKNAGQHRDYTFSSCRARGFEERDSEGGPPEGFCFLLRTLSDCQTERRGQACSESHSQPCSGLPCPWLGSLCASLRALAWQCLLRCTNPSGTFASRAASRAWGLLWLGLETRMCALSSNNPKIIQAHSII